MDREIRNFFVLRSSNMKRLKTFEHEYRCNYYTASRSEPAGTRNCDGMKLSGECFSRAAVNEDKGTAMQRD